MPETLDYRGRMTTFNDRDALEQFVAREGHARVPAHHIEIVGSQEFPLGAFVRNLRNDYRDGRLTPQTIKSYEDLGFQWAPRGPRRDDVRNAEIFRLRDEGLSLTRIAEKFDITRQRVHQILKQR